MSSRSGFGRSHPSIIICWISATCQLRQARRCGKRIAADPSDQRTPRATRRTSLTRSASKRYQRRQNEANAPDVPATQYAFGIQHSSGADALETTNTQIYQVETANIDQFLANAHQQQITPKIRPPATRTYHLIKHAPPHTPHIQQTGSQLRSLAKLDLRPRL